MLRAKAAMGFKSVPRVEVKAETTTPGEVRTTTDANGMRVSTSRARRTLPKLEFVIEENGAILHGPQRGLFPYYSTSQYYHTETGSSTALIASETQMRNVASTSFSSLHLRDFGAIPTSAVPAPSSNQEEAAASTEADVGEDESEDVVDRGSFRKMSAPSAHSTTPMKDCVLNDTRATTLAVKYDNSVGKFVCGSSIERFSGHTGVCRVLGSKKYPIIPHSLQIGDLLRIGSVGLVVCEINRGPAEENLESLTEEEYQYIKENFLSVPLQQTFRPTDPRNNNDGEHDDDDGEDDEESRQNKLRAGETSDEGESEEDGHKRASEDSEDGECFGGGARSKAHRLKDGLGGEKRFCYICYDGEEEPDENPLVAPCNCKGDTKYVHLECLQRWNNNLDADGTNPNQKMCAVTNTDGLDVCSICKATYLTSVKLEDGRVVSLMAKKLPPPYVTFAVVTQHETRSRSTTLTNTRFQLSFANMPRGQPYLTIGRSTTNNMTLRYRTVSQLHAKLKFEDNNFYLYDAQSSNGTMLFLSRPLELEWNKTMHVKIGRTILTLKSKKRWKWSGGGEVDEDPNAAIASPQSAHALLTPPTDELNNQTQETTTATPRPPTGNRFEVSAASLLSDPSAELLTSPFAVALRQPLNRTFTSTLPFPSHQFNRPFAPPADIDPDLDGLRLSDIVDEGSIGSGGSRGSFTQAGFAGTPRRSLVSTPSNRDSSENPRGLSRHLEQRDRPGYDYVERLSHVSIGSPQYVDRLSALDRLDRS
ncbi:hypothetical protein Poli38472_009479 [Pythium oligandrum]|uniref:Uncharacterized protein n=1 Tax=Pythium oligandrum TaxID=41045 RepID=A0A8K1CEJ8_PYTOL|nr:hypothetical protein Poli38472_009479 [Pythium oligandrum]|eukprot:TMW61986.1 hypothetical protein Poli38472_009479 [Pythium oligandrum]